MLVALIRHACTLTSDQGSGVGGALLEFLKRETDLRLLKRYWNIPQRPIEESVVLSR